jgi:hypothetical protein
MLADHLQGRGAVVRDDHLVPGALEGTLEHEPDVLVVLSDDDHGTSGLCMPVIRPEAVGEIPNEDARGKRAGPVLLPYGKHRGRFRAGWARWGT